MNLHFEIPMDFMYDMEIHDKGHMLDMIRDGELRPSDLLAGAYLKGEDEWTFIPNRALKEISDVVG